MEATLLVTRFACFDQYHPHKPKWMWVRLVEMIWVLIPTQPKVAAGGGDDDSESHRSISAETLELPGCGTEAPPGVVSDEFEPVFIPPRTMKTGVVNNLDSMLNWAHHYNRGLQESVDPKILQFLQERLESTTYSTCFSGVDAPGSVARMDGLHFWQWGSVGIFLSIPVLQISTVAV